MTSSALKSLVHEVSTRKIFAQAVDDAEGSSVGARIWTQCKDILITLLLLHAPNVRCLRFLVPAAASGGQIPCGYRLSFVKQFRAIPRLF